MKRRTLVGILTIFLISLVCVVLFEGDIPAATVDAKYSNAQSKFLTTEDGSRIHYRDQGNASGTPLVLIHGAMASLHTWEPWVHALGQRYRVITLDLPAHGLTGRVQSDNYGGPAFTSVIDAVTKAVGIEKFVLGGNSMGGGATWQYTLEHPEKVIAMILVDSVPPGNWSNSEPELGTDRGPGPLAFRLLQQDWFRAIAAYIDPWPLVGQGLRSAYNNSSVVNDELAARYYELIMREGTRSAILGGGKPSTRATNQLSDLNSLQQPTLIMWGAQDSIISVSTVSLFKENIPNTTTIIYDDLGHIPMEEDPERSAADVERFLDFLEKE
ncbi:alpha/beta hydrolase [OM182 bacterium]|jgi:pimeloyl-ACP methyl ester carboxylesterase|nr:alpha/beta hydrolase [OM182 bacterium]